MFWRKHGCRAGILQTGRHSAGRLPGWKNRQQQLRDISVATLMRRKPTSSGHGYAPIGHAKGADVASERHRRWRRRLLDTGTNKSRAEPLGTVFVHVFLGHKHRAACDTRRFRSFVTQLQKRWSRGQEHNSSQALGFYVCVLF